MKKTMVAAALIAAAVSAQAQVPTSNVELALAAARQLEQARQQYEALQSQIRSLTGNRGFAAILNNPLVRGNMPEDVRHIYNAGQRAQYGSISSAIEELSRTEALSGTSNERRKKMDERRIDTSLASKALAQRAYDGEQAELDNIERQIEQIKMTNDTKGAAEVQASLAAAQARISARSNQIALLAWMSNNEQKLLENQRAALDADLLDPNRRSMPRIRLWNER